LTDDVREVDQLHWTCIIGVWVSGRMV